MERVLVSIMIIVLTGCSPLKVKQGLVSSVDNTMAKIKGRYIVKSGDTLHAIALDLDKDFVQLVKLNHLKKPYTIFPGQVLKLRGHIIAPVESREIAKKTRSQKAQSKQVAKKSNQSQIKPIGRAPGLNKQRKRAKQSLQAAKSLEWVWPATGRILSDFYQGTSQQKGIDISGVEQAPVYSAADGEVVYSGNGLRGYGNLIIVKHENNFLSAYAHNKKNIVKEGDHIRKGQKIAEMGNSGANRVMLHFEVRHHGKPVDPLTILPIKKKASS